MIQTRHCCIKYHSLPYSKERIIHGHIVEKKKTFTDPQGEECRILDVYYIINNPAYEDYIHSQNSTNGYVV